MVTKLAMDKRRVRPIISEHNVKNMKPVGEIADHLWGDMPVAIDTETTGVDPAVDSIWELAIIPLNRYFLPRTDLVPLSLKIQPKVNIDRIDFRADVNMLNRPRILDAYKTGLAISAAIDMFHYWFETLKLAPGKKIIPIGHNVSFDVMMMQIMMGADTYAQYFSHKIRDTMQIEAYLDDVSALKGQKLRSRGYHRLGTVIEGYEGITNYNAHNAMSDALVAAQLYSAQVRHIPED